MVSKTILVGSERVRRVLIIAVAMLLFIGSIASAGGVQIRFFEKPPQRAKLLDTISVHWAAEPQVAGTECRYKLDVPGDWKGGVHYAIAKWSQWGACEGSAVYTDFVKEGEYQFVVEARTANLGRARGSCQWQMYWEYPEIRGEALSVDFARVQSARTKQEKYKILADEYHTRYEMSMREFRYQARLLKLTTSPEELVQSVAGALLGKAVGAGALIQTSIDAARELDMAAAAGQGVALQRVLSVKIIYDIIKHGAVDLILVYRNAQANAACSRAVVAYYGWKHFERLAGTSHKTSKSGEGAQVPLQLTSRNFTENDDLDAACRAEFGPESHLADWQDVKSAWAKYGRDLPDLLGLKGNALVQCNGQRFWHRPRHYFISRHDGRKPPGFLAHDELGGYVISLGSWYHRNMQALCVVNR